MTEAGISPLGVCVHLCKVNSHSRAKVGSLGQWPLAGVANWRLSCFFLSYSCVSTLYACCRTCQHIEPILLLIHAAAVQVCQYILELKSLPNGENYFDKCVLTATRPWLMNLHDADDR